MLVVKFQKCPHPFSPNLAGADLRRSDDVKSRWPRSQFPKKNGAHESGFPLSREISRSAASLSSPAAETLSDGCLVHKSRVLVPIWDSFFIWGNFHIFRKRVLH